MPKSEQRDIAMESTKKKILEFDEQLRALSDQAD